MKNQILKRELFCAVMLLLSGILLIVCYHAFQLKPKPVVLLLYFSLYSCLITLGICRIMFLFISFFRYEGLKSRLQHKSLAEQVKVLYNCAGTGRCRNYLYFCTAAELQEIKTNFLAGQFNHANTLSQLFLYDLKHYLAKRQAV